MTSVDILILVGLAVVIVLLVKNRDSKGDDKSALLLQNQMNEVNRTVQKQYGESAKIIKEVTEGLTRLDQTNKQVINFADQLKSLQDISLHCAPE